MKNYYKFVPIILVIILSYIIFTKYNSSDIQNIISEHDKQLWNYNRNFNDYVVFYPQHQDDEVLWAGSCIVRAIEQCGSEKVYVVLVSDGTGVNIFKESKYNNLSRKEKEELRNSEFKNSLQYLGINNENIIILSDIDHKSGTHFELMKEIALNFENQFESVTHIAHSYKYDDHPMHRKNGKVIKTLYENKEIKDVMYFIKPKYTDKIDDNLKVLYTCQTLKEYDKIINACYMYKLKDNNKKIYGIGYKSAHSYFDRLMNDPNLPSILHLPLN